MPDSEVAAEESKKPVMPHISELPRDLEALDLDPYCDRKVLLCLTLFLAPSFPSANLIRPDIALIAEAAVPVAPWKSKDVQHIGWPKHSGLYHHPDRFQVVTRVKISAP